MIICNAAVYPHNDKKALLRGIQLSCGHIKEKRERGNYGK